MNEWMKKNVQTYTTKRPVKMTLRALSAAAIVVSNCFHHISFSPGIL